MTVLLALVGLALVGAAIFFADDSKDRYAARHIKGWVFYGLIFLFTIATLRIAT